MGGARRNSLRGLIGVIWIFTLFDYPVQGRYQSTRRWRIYRKMCVN